MAIHSLFGTRYIFAKQTVVNTARRLLDSSSFMRANRSGILGSLVWAISMHRLDYEVAAYIDKSGDPCGGHSLPEDCLYAICVADSGALFVIGYGGAATAFARSSGVSVCKGADCNIFVVNPVGVIELLFEALDFIGTDFKPSLDGSEEAIFHHSAITLANMRVISNIFSASNDAELIENMMRTVEVENSYLLDDVQCHNKIENLVAKLKTYYSPEAQKGEIAEVS